MKRSSSLAASTRTVLVPPQRKANGAFVFADAPADFAPNLSPAEVFHAGAFGGTYFRPIHSGVTKKDYRDQHLEFPAAYFSGLDIGKMVTSSTYRPEINKFGVKSGTSLLDWESAGWIAAQDPYGWFQWYCRFYEGRRSEDDDRQISRWKKCAGVNGRWKANLVAKIVRAGAAFDDASISPVVRQTLWHWAYQLTEEEFEREAARYRKTGKAPYLPAAAETKVAGAAAAAATESGKKRRR